MPGLWDTLATRFANLGRPPRVVIHGGYGKNNMGDDALLHVIRGRVLAAFPNAEIHVVCHGPERVVERYRDDPAGPVTSSHFKSARPFARPAEATSTSSAAAASSTASTPTRA